MPWKPPGPCARPGCRTLGHERYCDAHQKQERQEQDQRRGSAASRGYGRKWQAARIDFIRRHPICIACHREGRVAATTVVDHIVPHRGDEKLFWRRSNWQPLCKTCHDAKTAREDGGWGRAGGG